MSQIYNARGQSSKQQKLKELMERLELEALLLRRSTNFAWYTGGADNRVDHASPLRVADILLMLDAEYIFTNNIEAPRMREEQTPGFEVIEHPWYEDEVSTIREVYRLPQPRRCTDTRLVGGASAGGQDRVAKLQQRVSPSVETSVKSVAEHAQRLHGVPTTFQPVVSPGRKHRTTTVCAGPPCDVPVLRSRSLAEGPG